MIVADWMNNHPVTLHPDETVEKARELLERCSETAVASCTKRL